MDQNVLKIRATEVAETLKRFLQSVLQSPHRGSVRAEHPAGRIYPLPNSVRLDKHQAERDSSLLAEVAGKNTSIREDVMRFGTEHSAAQGQALEASVTQILATIRAEMSDQHKAITEEIAAAVRSNFEILMAEIKGKR